MTTRQISEDIRARVRAAAGERCGYCLTRQRYAMQVLEIEHIVPKAKGGTDDEDNLWLACCLSMEDAIVARQFELASMR